MSLNEITLIAVGAGVTMVFGLVGRWVFAYFESLRNSQGYCPEHDHIKRTISTITDAQDSIKKTNIQNNADIAYIKKSIDKNEKQFNDIFDRLKAIEVLVSKALQQEYGDKNFFKK